MWQKLLIGNIFNRRLLILPLFVLGKVFDFCLRSFGKEVNEESLSLSIFFNQTVKRRLPDDG